MKPNLLIVDDDPRMRRLVRSIVRDLSNNILECADGAGAVLTYHQHQPDWVLMDVEMPGYNGLTATKKIRAAFPQARIVIVTKHDGPAMREVARKAGAAFVSKENLIELREILSEQEAPEKQGSPGDSGDCAPRPDNDR